MFTNCVLRPDHPCTVPKVQMRKCTDTRIHFIHGLVYTSDLVLPQLSMQTSNWRARQFRIIVHSWQYVASGTIRPGKFDVLKRTATQIVYHEANIFLSRLFIEALAIWNSWFLPILVGTVLSKYFDSWHPWLL